VPVSEVFVVVSVVVLLLDMLPDELLDMPLFVVLLLVVPYVELLVLVFIDMPDMLPLVPAVFCGVFMSLFVLFVMLPVPVPPVFEPALGGVPATSVAGLMPLVFPLLVVLEDDDIVLFAVVLSVLLFPLSRFRSERQPKAVMASASRKIRVSFVLLLFIGRSP
jgi:hypothetical protein